MKELKELIAKLANQELQEVLRGFSLNKFKNMLDKDVTKHSSAHLQQIKKLVNYAKEHLPFLGQGTSRAVFALSGDKVLKIANGKTLAGIAQNKQEVNLYTNPKTKPVVTKVYDVADDYSWIVSEIAKPFSSRAEFRQKTGVSADVLDEFVDFIVPGDFEKSCEVYAAVFSLVDLEPDDPYEEIVEWYKTNFKGTVIEHAVDLAALGAAPGDLGHYGHWGVTTDGRVVAIDYGLTRRILRNFY